MNLDSVMKSNTIKTASATTPAAAPPKTPTAAPTSKTAGAVAEAVAAVSKTTEKTASAAGQPLAAIEKLAGELAEQDHNASLKQASLIGAAMADGFVSQLSMYEKVAEEMQSKTASLIVPQGEQLDPDFVALVKQAQQDPQGFLELVKQAAAAEDAQLKQAEDEMAAQLEQNIQVKAAEHYATGYEVGKLMVSAG